MRNGKISQGAAGYNPWREGVRRGCAHQQSCARRAAGVCRAVPAQKEGAEGAVCLRGRAGCGGRRGVSRRAGVGADPHPCAACAAAHSAVRQICELQGLHNLAGGVRRADVRARRRGVRGEQPHRHGSERLSCPRSDRIRGAGDARRRAVFCTRTRQDTAEDLSGAAHRGRKRVLRRRAVRQRQHADGRRERTACRHSVREVRRRHRRVARRSARREHRGIRGADDGQRTRKPAHRQVGRRESGRQRDKGVRRACRQGL